MANPWIKKNNFVLSYPLSKCLTTSNVDSLSNPSKKPKTNRNFSTKLTIQIRINLGYSVIHPSLEPSSYQTQDKF